MLRVRHHDMHDMDAVGTPHTRISLGGLPGRFPGSSLMRMFARWTDGAAAVVAQRALNGWDGDVASSIALLTDQLLEFLARSLVVFNHVRPIVLDLIARGLVDSELTERQLRLLSFDHLLQIRLFQRADRSSLGTNRKARVNDAALATITPTLKAYARPHPPAVPGCMILEVHGDRHWAHL